MFTGLIQGLGRIRRLQASAAERFMEIEWACPAADIAGGESISINGVCLTVEKALEDGFSAYASGETVSRSTLGQLETGQSVNVERALRLADRLGGHLVSGHVDAVVAVRDISSAGSSRQFVLELPGHLSGQVAAKGSVALDGVSLTVNQCARDFFTVNIIPETLRNTTLGQWRRGGKVNLETDVLAKYIARQLALAETGAVDGGAAGLSLDFFRRHGF